MSEIAKTLQIGAPSLTRKFKIGSHKLDILNSTVLTQLLWAGIYLARNFEEIRLVSAKYVCLVW